MTEILNLAKKLIALNTVEGNVKENRMAIDTIKDCLKDYTIEEFEKNSHKSLLIHNRKNGTQNFKLILNGHLDIIPGKDFQLKAKIKNNKLYGVGSMDMKSSIAVMVYVFKKYAKKVDYPLALQIVTDEETGGFDGTGHQVNIGVRADFVISAEATGLNIENKTKGIVWATIKAEGESAHSAYPWKGRNSIESISEVIQNIKNIFPNPSRSEWQTTHCISGIKTPNSAFNKIPDICSIDIDLRYIPEHSKKVIKDLKKCCVPGTGLEVIVNEPPVDTPTNDYFVKLLSRSVKKEDNRLGETMSANGSSDLRHFAKVGCMGVEFGPKGGGMGSDNEWVDIESLKTFQSSLSNFLLALKEEK